jgi:hypothetical protein
MRGLSTELGVAPPITCVAPIGQSVNGIGGLVIGTGGISVSGRRVGGACGSAGGIRFHSSA